MKSSTWMKSAIASAIYHTACGPPKRDERRLPPGVRGAILVVQIKESAGGSENPFGVIAHHIGIRKRAMQIEIRVTGPIHHRSARITLWLALAAASGVTLSAAQQQQQQPPPTQQAPPQQTEPPAKQEKGDQSTATLPRGKKLYLKDGSVQVVREYERTGDTVHYYSLLESQWEEIPAALVDWDATAKAEADQAAKEKEFANRVATQERNREAIPQLDIDASLLVAPGVILPQDLGMFALAGSKVVKLEEIRTTTKADKGRVAEQILSPIPMVPGRQRVEIKGKHSAVRLPAGELQFYLRINVDDPEPEVDLLRAHPDGETRRLEWINYPVAGEPIEQRETLSTLKWQVAKGVFRFTINQTMEPGEYALAILTENKLNVFVWDFGVDPAPQGPAKNK
jgi:hypothetical protein